MSIWGHYFRLGLYLTYFLYLGKNFKVENLEIALWGKIKLTHSKRKIYFIYIYVKYSFILLSVGQHRSFEVEIVFFLL